MTTPLPEGAIGVDGNNLPYFTPTRYAGWNHQVQVWKNQEPFFLCVTCQHYKKHLHFSVEVLAVHPSSKWKCIRCGLMIKRRTTPVARIRRVRIGSDGASRVFCRLCGYYLLPEKFQKWTLKSVRTACSRCHTDRVISGQKRNVPSRCISCGGATTKPRCEWCVFGAPPITASKLLPGRNIDAKYKHRNAAFLMLGDPVAKELRHVQHLKHLLEKN